MRFAAVQHVSLSLTTNINKFMGAQLICCRGIHSERRQDCTVRCCRQVNCDQNIKVGIIYKISISTYYNIQIILSTNTLIYNEKY